MAFSSREPAPPFVSALVLLFASLTDAHAGAWPQPVGTTEAIISLSHSLAHRQFDPSGNAVSRGRFRKIEMQLYAEHGLSERITLIGKVIRSTDKTEALGLQFTDSAFRRLEIGTRTHIFTWDDTLYSVDGVIGLHTASQGDDPAASQSGDFDLEAGLTTGAPFAQWGLTGFNETRIAYRYRPGVRPSEAIADVTLGLRFGTDWMALLKSSNIYSTGRTPSPLGHYWSSKADLSIVHTLEPGFNIEAGTFRTLFGQNVLKETGFKLSFWYRF